MCSAVPCPASCFCSTRGAPSPAALYRNGWNFLSGWSYPDPALLLHWGPARVGSGYRLEFPSPIT